MRVIIALAAAGGLGLITLTGLWLWDRLAARRIGLTDGEARRLLQTAVRQLDVGVNDPMLRQSTAWENESQAIVNRYYGKRLHK